MQLSTQTNLSTCDGNMQAHLRRFTPSSMRSQARGAHVARFGYQPITVSVNTLKPPLIASMLMHGLSLERPSKQTEN